MLILTQDGRRVVKFKDITDLYISYLSNYGIYYDTNDDCEVLLGTYKDKERCKEVLKEITSKYSRLEMSRLYAKSGKYDYPRIESFVYEMPEE